MGFVLSKEGVSPNKNVVAIQQFPIPKSVKEVKRFLGLPIFIEGTSITWGL